MAACAVLTRHPEMSWAAVAAFWTCLVDPGGATGLRAKVLTGFTLAGGFIAMLCASVANLGLEASAALVFILAMLAGALRVYGAEASTLSNLLLVDAVYTISRPLGSVWEVAIFGALFFAGCIWASVLSLTLWRIHPFQPAREALAAAFEELSAMSWSLAAISGAETGDAAWVNHAQRHRRTVREAIELSRRRVAQVQRQRGGVGYTARQIQTRLSAAESAFALMIALTDSLERRPATTPPARRHIAQSLKRLAVAYQRVCEFIKTRDADPANLQTALHRFERGASSRADIDQLLRASALEIHHVIDSEPGALANLVLPSVGNASLWERLLNPIVKELHWRSQSLRHALRLAVAVMIAYVITRLFNLAYGYWMTMTVVIILQPQVATTWARGLERILGSVLGGALAALLGFIFVSQGALLALIFPLAVATMAFRPVNYTLFVFFLTPLFVLILDLTHPEVRETALVLTRAANTLTGGAIALAASLLLWPGSGSNQLRLDLAAAIERNAAFARLALGKTLHPSEAIDQARREAGLASNLAETTHQRAALETWWRPNERAAADVMLGVLRRLAGAATAYWVHTDAIPTPEGAAVADWIEATAHNLADAIRTGASPPPLSAAPRAAATNAMILEIQDLYRTAGAMPVHPRADRPGLPSRLAVRQGR